MVSISTLHGKFSSHDVQLHSHAVSCFERLFGLKFIRRIAKDAEKMVGCLYHSRNYLIPSAMIYLFTRPRTDQNWSIVAIFGLKLFNHHFPTLTESKSVNTALWTQHRKFITILSLFLQQKFKQAPFFSAPTSELYSLNPPCYIHSFESPSLHLYFIFKKGVLSNNRYLMDSCVDAFPNATVFKSSVNRYSSFISS